METRPAFDVMVVGSGLSGAMAASTLVRSGLRVAMLDVGFDDATARTLVPDRPFSEIRRTDAQQHRYFLGEALEGVPTGGVRIGAQLTPPRRFITRGVDQYLPWRSTNFFPIQSLALGGLGAGWGATCHTFSRTELAKLGISEPAFHRYYDEVAAEIGVSGDANGDCASFALEGVRSLQPPLRLDTNHARLLAAYGRRRNRLNAAGCFVDRMPLAALSIEHRGRAANPYQDMEFWSDVRKSVYRPRYTIDELKRESNFHYLGGCLAIRFAETAAAVQVDARHLPTGTRETLTAARLILCAGAINSARLALNSLGLARIRTPLLCNPYVYYPCINLRMLGRAAADDRSSLAQLRALVFARDSAEDPLLLQFYSYRSLLLFKLVQQLPLPTRQGLLTVRLLMNALTIVGLHHPDAAADGKWMRILTVERDRLPEIEFQYDSDAHVKRQQRARERHAIRCLRMIGCFPVGRVDPGAAASIHYAGTLTDGHATDARIGTDDVGRLRGCRRVHVADSSSWRFLPAKGSGFSLMAHARYIASRVAGELRS